ncbi:L,D-transpeptidase family protein [Acanthopleuribacter pedis]|nr:L,D-transpeptidase family protein [Acanthopleuribacter pedis]
MSRADRILRLRANLERRRWLPRSLGSHHILVNIANYHVAVVANETAVMEMKAVVGRPFRQTPVFSAQMTYLVLSPFWHVPPSLASKDKLPILLKDPGKLADQGYRIFDGWGSDAKELSLEEARTRLAGAKRFPFRFRQDPGPKNALGDVKFMFPNSYNVYLHDTPDRNLFGKSERSFSSGCIRISRPIDLAEFLLSDQPGWSRERIEAAIAKRQEQTITLKQRYRVHLLYWTVAVKDDRVHVIPDIYERDGRLVTALKEVEEDPS